MNIEYIGYLATTFSIIGFIPIIYNIYKTGKTNNFPIKALIIAIISNLLWLIYGINKNAKANILSSIIFVLIHSYIIFKKYKE